MRNPAKVQFTTEEADTIVLGWHEALLISFPPSSPISTSEIVPLDEKTGKASGVLREDVEAAVAILERCAQFHDERYAIQADPHRDSVEFLQQTYPMQQDSQDVQRRLLGAIRTLRSKLQE